MSRATARKSVTVEGQVDCPFSIQVDTREQQPYTFKGLHANVKDKSRPIRINLEFLAVPNGDYTIYGNSDKIGIERKSKEDLFGSVTRRENFKGRLKRMHAMAESGGYGAVVVECEFGDLLQRPAHSRLSSKSLIRTILAWRQRYRVDWHFVPDRAWGEAITFRILERWYLDHNKVSHEA